MGPCGRGAVGPGPSRGDAACMMRTSIHSNIVFRQCSGRQGGAIPHPTRPTCPGTESDWLMAWRERSIEAPNMEGRCSGPKALERLSWRMLVQAYVCALKRFPPAPSVVPYLISRCRFAVGSMIDPGTAYECASNDDFVYGGTRCCFFPSSLFLE